MLAGQSYRLESVFFPELNPLLIQDGFLKMLICFAVNYNWIQN